MTYLSFMSLGLLFMLTLPHALQNHKISTKYEKTSHQTVGCFIVRHSLHTVHRFMNSLFCRNWGLTDRSSDILANETVYAITSVNNPNLRLIFPYNTAPEHTRVRGTCHYHPPEGHHGCPAG